MYTENLKERDNFGDSGTGGRIVLKCILEMWVVDCIQLVQNRN
jgi:hypothetical protein